MKIDVNNIKSMYVCVFKEKAKYAIKNKNEVWRISGISRWLTPTPYNTGGLFSEAFSKYIIRII
ncbi:MAG: hypothetical protein WC523_04710 [Patescibacteria group bacterium]